MIAPAVDTLGKIAILRHVRQGLPVDVFHQQRLAHLLLEAAQQLLVVGAGYVFIHLPIESPQEPRTDLGRTARAAMDRW